MAERLADIVAQIQNVHQLEAVVTAMRGIAASRAQKARSLLAGVEAYSEVVSRAIGQALSLLPFDAPAAPPRGRAKPALILFCAEQGFAGAFSERVLEAAAADIHQATVFVVGTRGAIIAREQGIEPAWSEPMAGHSDAIPSFANRLADDLYGYVASGAVAEVDILYARSTSAGGTEVERHSLLPVDFERFGRPPRHEAPLISLPPDILLERLAEEYVYAQLCEAALHAFAAENEARMIAMLAARTNIDKKLSALTNRERQLRQQEITTEVVELAAGAEASRSPSSI
ncbi:MAG: F0F1 ATP synthase subunit gamma [Pseudolabrys sp.]|jgi:F-type H+-transporting ATPase subunit gamma